jgi:hypothetical protein
VSEDGQHDEYRRNGQRRGGFPFEEEDRASKDGGDQEGYNRLRPQGHSPRQGADCESGCKRPDGDCPIGGSDSVQDPSAEDPRGSQADQRGEA